LKSKLPAAAEMQRWSEDVARDPASLAFLPLARAYRRQGRREAALRLCLKGLERHPDHVDAHGLLARLYLESGDRRRAADEWSIVLRLEADNFEALRGLGFCFLEQNELGKARQHLERAALVRPGDATVAEALRLLHDQQAAPPTHVEEPVAGAGPWQATPPVYQPVAGSATSSAAAVGDPSALFDALLASGPLLGALVIDAQGLVLAGRLVDGSDADTLGAVLNGAIDEAARTVGHLGLGTWHGMLLETQEALVHVAPAVSDGVVLLAARRDAPMGWVLRAAGKAAAAAQEFLGGSA
jgi:predicted regulator of Ras-like GTPase activity (Roadblock/LC7/MglB family)